MPELLHIPADIHYNMYSVPAYKGFKMVAAGAMIVDWTL
jgi:hypothetical protein